MQYQFAEKSQYKVAQITDCHLFASRDGLYRGANSAAHLQAIVDTLCREQPDAVLLTGDLTQDHSSESYTLLAQLLSPLNCPVFCLPGNHDDEVELAALCQQQPMQPERNLILGDWQLLLLNTKSATPAGGFSSIEQRWLAEQCRQSQATAIWLFCHHHPLPINSFIDKHGQQQQAELWRAIVNDDRIRGIAHGHVHHAYERQHLDRTVVGCPASSVQFLLADDWQTCDEGPQWCDWTFTADGKVSWQFRRLTTT